MRLSIANEELERQRLHVELMAYDGKEIRFEPIFSFKPIVDALVAILGIHTHLLLFWQFTIEYGKMHEEMLRAWSEKCMKELEAHHEHSAH